ncbi:MAG: hypothetical protein GWM90_18255 [Gemmatimonadetes bacterium]|nr:hypothetical protein [Gemmatimonadota bacterium]NIQ56293.1 hypothetical protein [Gemmatimonadota bacterium]NIU76479.1 hypothetical protein [Gammaproteobacteria bacterium]NIX45964.1 hypothetical protein [Gemmatimonadota bacterium]NIY10280.1 hypothetical protein [Gemmatimonadota bacterium]
MSSRSPRRQYLQWVEDRIEDYKASLTRDELLSLADQAVTDLFETEDGQYPLTEILLRDAVDALIFQRLGLPGYRRWLRTCQSDTPPRPPEGTQGDENEGLQAS